MRVPYIVGLSKYDERKAAMKRGAAVLFLSFLIAGVGLVPSSAAAKHRPYIYWTLPATANEGQPVSFIWRGKYFGRGYKVVVERPFGTSHVWKGIMRLDASGNGQLPGMRLGSHWFRIAVFRGRMLVAQQTSVIKIFGTVPFTTLLDDEQPDVYTAPGHSFSYVGSYWSVYHGETTALFGVSNNNCSSVHVAFVPGDHYENGVGSLSVVQESRDPVSGSAPFDGVGSVDAELTPGQTWGVNASIAEGHVASFYINGYATCYSTEPFSE